VNFLLIFPVSVCTLFPAHSRWRFSALATVFATIRFFAANNTAALKAPARSQFALNESVVENRGPRALAR